MNAATSSDLIPEDIRSLYEIRSYRKAAEVLTAGCPQEFAEILEALRSFRLTLADIRKRGGNNSDIAKAHRRTPASTRLAGNAHQR